MGGEQVSPPAPFRKGASGSRWEVATHPAGMNPAYLVQDGGETGFPPSPLPQSGVGESLGSSNSYGRSESGLSEGREGSLSSSTHTFFVKTTQGRKADHIRINVEEDVDSKGIDSGFDQVRFLHSALPEMDLD